MIASSSTSSSIRLSPYRHQGVTALRGAKTSVPRLLGPRLVVNMATADRDLTFYTHSLCPYAHRVSLCLAEKAIPHKREHIDLSNKPRWYLDLNRRGLVPAIQLDREVKTESLELNTFDDVFDGAARLTPDGRKEEMQTLIDSFDGSFISAGLQFVGGGWGFRRGAPGPRQVDRMAVECERIERIIEINGSGGPYLMGSEVTLADLALWPFAERYELAMREFQGVELREMGPTGSLSRWIDAMRSRPSVVGLRPDDNKLLASWRRTMRLDYFDYETADVDNP